MLHLKNWQGSQKGIYSLIFLLPLTVLLFSRCGQGKSYQEEKITMEAFSDMKTPIFVFDFPSIQRHLSSIANAEPGITEADRCTKEIYQETKHLIWIDKTGVNHRADSLLVWLRQVNEIGMSPNAFGVASIEQDLQRIRTLDVDGEKDMSQLAARLECAMDMLIHIASLIDCFRTNKTRWDMSLAIRDFSILTWTCRKAIITRRCYIRWKSIVLTAI